MTGPSGETVTLQEAAEALGVHYMTAYRYVRLGLLPARKEGASWRVERDDVEAFRAGSTSGVAGASQPGRRRAPWAERLEDRLLAGDGRGAWGVVEAALTSGTDVTGVYLDILAPAMASIGQRWAAGEIDIGDEHRASGIVQRLVGRLGPRFARRGRTRGTMVLGAPLGDQHSLPGALVADVVRAAGFDVSDLGANVPPESFLRMAVGAPRLVAMGLSVMHADSLGQAARTIEVLREGTAGATPIIIGGYAVRDEAHAHELGADDYGGDARMVVALLDRFTGRSPNEGDDDEAAGQPS